MVDWLLASDFLTIFRWLTLQKAENLVWQRATVSQQQHALNAPVENKPQLEAIKQQRQVIKQPQHRLPPLQRKPTSSQPRAPTLKCRQLKNTPMQKTRTLLLPVSL